MTHKMLKKNTGLTLIELIIALAILITVLTGAYLSYIQIIELNSMTANKSTIIQEMANKLEDMKDETFLTVKTTYNGTTFDISGITGKGVVYINDTNPDLVIMTVTFSWKEKSGRITGEDTNFNGVIDSGEDKNNNGMLDSPLTLITQIRDK